MNDILNHKIFLKKIIGIFFIYMLLEGVLRKWILPSFSSQIYFVKDFILIFIYITALKYDLIFKLNFTKLFLFIILLISLFGFFGYHLDKTGVISYILGLRSYWLFLPLFLIIMHVYDEKDVVTFLKLNTYSIIPYFFLILLQSNVSLSSFLNSGLNGNLMSPERPSGYFTYTTQNTYYFLFLFYSFCSYILYKKEFFVWEKFYFVIINFCLFAIMILLKSRAVYVYIFTTIFLSSFFLILSNHKVILKIKKLFFILFLSFFSFHICSKLVLVEQYEYSEVRINTDPYYEMDIVTENKNVNLPLLETTVEDFCSKNSSLCRIFNELYFIPAAKIASLSGNGLGAGTAAVSIYKKNDHFLLGETENSRIVLELGFLIGSIFVVIKMIISVILGIMALLKIRDHKNLIYIPILIFIGVQLLLGPLTYTTSFISFIFWFSLGMLFSSYKKTNLIK